MKKSFDDTSLPASTYECLSSEIMKENEQKKEDGHIQPITRTKSQILLQLPKKILT